jgi:hypothetical protein
LYEKAGCHLCEDAYRALDRMRGVSLEIERVDIEGDPALFDRYAIRIPVLAVGERELDAAGLADEAVRRWLTEMTPPVG